MKNKEINIKEVRRFSLKAFYAVSRLLPQLDPGLELLTSERFKAILKSETTHLYLAEINDKQIIGMLTLATYQIPSGNKVWVEDVVVDESFRGKGLGKELMIYAIDIAKSNGAEAIELTSRPSRIAANKLYQELGFVIRDTNCYKYFLK